MVKYIYVVAFECDGLLSFSHRLLNDVSSEDEAYSIGQIELDSDVISAYEKIPGFKMRNNYVIVLDE